MIIFMRKKLACIFICAILVLDMMLNVTAVAATEKEVVQSPKLHAVAAALYDADEHMTIYGKNSNESMANASTTKILTCIVTLENSQLSDTVKVSGNAASQPQVALGLVEGDTYNMKDLMYGMMLESYNDCAYAIAEHVAGTVEEFAKLPPLVQKAVGTPDNLRNWAVSDYQTIESVIQSNFLRTYRTVVKRESEINCMPNEIKALIDKTNINSKSAQIEQNNQRSINSLPHDKNSNIGEISKREDYVEAPKEFEDLVNRLK